MNGKNGAKRGSAVSDNNAKRSDSDQEYTGVAKNITTIVRWPARPRARCICRWPEIVEARGSSHARLYNCRISAETSCLAQLCGRQLDKRAVPIVGRSCRRPQARDFRAAVLIGRSVIARLNSVAVLGVIMIRIAQYAAAKKRAERHPCHRADGDHCEQWVMKSPQHCALLAQGFTGGNTEETWPQGLDECLPHGGRTQIADGGIPGDKKQIFHHSLGRQHAVKWITMLANQQSGPKCMPVRHR